MGDWRSELDSASSAGLLSRLPEPIHVVVLTAFAVETAAVRGSAHGPLAESFLFDKSYAVFEYASADGTRLRVASAEISTGATAAAGEVRRLAVAHPGAVLLFVGITGASGDLSTGDVIAGQSIVSVADPRLSRQGVRSGPLAHSSRDMVQIARKVACSDVAGTDHARSLERKTRAVVGQVACGEALVQAVGSSGRSKRLVIRGISGEAGKGSAPEEQAAAARAAAAFGFTVLDEYVRLLRLDRGTSLDEELAATTPAPHSADLSAQAGAYIDRICLEENLLPDNNAAAARLAASDFAAASSFLAYELVCAAAARIDDVGRTWAADRLRAYGRECARGMAGLCDSAPVEPGSPADIAVRFPVEQMLASHPSGAAVMLSVPEAWRCLDEAARGRVLTCLSGTPNSPRPPTEIGWRCLLDLVDSGDLTPAEAQRIARVVARSSYDLLALVRAPLTLLAEKLFDDLASGVFGRQSLAARFLYREADRLPGQLPEHGDYELGQHLQHAARAGSPGADEALSRSALVTASPARKAGVLMATLLIDDRYLRLELPWRAGIVLGAASLAGDLREVLALAAARLPEPVDEDLLSGYVAQEIWDMLRGLAPVLRADEAALWEGFTARLGTCV